MTAKPALLILTVAALAGAASGCGGTTSYGSRPRPLPPGMGTTDSLRFPPSTPAWIATAATQAAELLDDPHATVVSVKLGPHPVVVLTGTFTCSGCPRPSGSPAEPTGTYAAMGYDAATEEGTDFGLGNSQQQAMAGMCNGSACAAGS